MQQTLAMDMQTGAAQVEQCSPSSPQITNYLSKQTAALQTSLEDFQTQGKVVMLTSHRFPSSDSMQEERSHELQQSSWTLTGSSFPGANLRNLAAVHSHLVERTQVQASTSTKFQMGELTASALWDHPSILLLFSTVRMSTKSVRETWGAFVC